MTNFFSIDFTAYKLKTPLDKKQEIDVIKVYPNPSNGNFTLELNTKSYVSIINLTGKTVFEKELVKPEQVRLKEKGLYIIKIENEEQISVKKILVE